MSMRRRLWARIGGGDDREAATGVYRGVVAEARRRDLYADFGVPDNLDGRFEMLALHLFLVLHRLRAEADGRCNRIAQLLVDLFIDDLDTNLREMGAGDLGVGRRVKRMAAGFHGRVAAYDAGINGDGVSLEAAIRRNVYGTVTPLPAQVAAMAAHMRELAGRLARLPVASVLGNGAVLGASGDR